MSISARRLLSWQYLANTLNNKCTSLPEPNMSEQHHHHREGVDPAAPVKNLVTYVAKKGAEESLVWLVKKHETALRKIGLVTAEPCKVWKALNIRSGEVSIVEYFEWKDGKSSDVAHQSPEVMAVWEPMGPVLADLRICEVELL